MKSLLLSCLLLFTVFSLSSCASILNIITERDKCSYSGCHEDRLDNCSYCIDHCYGYSIPHDFDAKNDKAFKEQMERYAKERKRELNR